MTCKELDGVRDSDVFGTVRYKVLKQLYINFDLPQCNSWSFVLKLSDQGNLRVL